MNFLNTVICDECIFVIEGLSVEGKFRGHISYIHDAQGEKFCLYNNKTYSRLIIDDRNAHANRIPSYILVNEKSVDHYLTIDIPNNGLLISAQMALKNILDQKIVLDANSFSNLLKGIDWFVSNSGVPKKNLGLYGGFAAGLIKLVSNNYTDIDLVVYGNEYVANIVNVCERFPAGKLLELIEKKNNNAVATQINLETNIIRNSLRTAHPIDSNIDIDIWVNPLNFERYTMISDIVKNGTIQETFLTVSDNTNAFSLPCEYSGYSELNKKINMFSTKYAFLAAIKPGMKVVVTGYTFDDSNGERNILLCSTSENKIVYSAI